MAKKKIQLPTLVENLLQVFKHYESDTCLYEVTSFEDAYKLSTNNDLSNSHWCHDREELCKITDTGNGFNVKIKGNANMFFDYAELNYIQILMRYIDSRTEQDFKVSTIVSKEL